MVRGAPRVTDLSGSGVCVCGGGGEYPQDGRGLICMGASGRMGASERTGTGWRNTEHLVEHCSAVGGTWGIVQATNLNLRTQASKINITLSV